MPGNASMTIVLYVPFFLSCLRSSSVDLPTRVVFKSSLRALIRLLRLLRGAAAVSVVPQCGSWYKTPLVSSGLKIKQAYCQPAGSLACL